MGPRTKFWIKQGLGLVALFAVPALGARIGVDLWLSFPVSLAVVVSINLFLWPRMINGEVVSEEEWRGSIVGGFVLLAIAVAFGLFVFWSIQHFEAKRQASIPEELSYLSPRTNVPGDSVPETR